jgi:phage gp29-like protein
MRQAGIWTSPFDFRPIDRGPGTLFEEIATRDRSPDFFSLAMSLPDPDPVLRKLGKDIKVYKELLSDSRVGPCVESRKAAVIALEWDVARGNAPAAVAKFVRQCLARLKVDEIIREILNAPLYGMQPLEVIWRRDGKNTVPDRVVGKPVDWFVFAPEDNSLRLRTKNNLIQGEPLPEKKFLLPRYNATYENPYGERVLSRCFWPVTFKKGGLKFWLRMAEKFGSPYLWGKYPRGAEDSAINDLSRRLEDAIQDAIIVTPDDDSVQILEAAGKAGSSALYHDLKESCDTDIAICILGQNLSTNVKSGSLAAAEVQERVRGEIKDGDKKIVVQTMGSLIDWICELNFGPGERPVFELFEEEEVDQKLATRDKTLSDTGQVKFTKRYFMKAYSLEDEDFDVVAGSPVPGGDATPTEFAQAPGATTSPAGDPVDALAAALTPEQLQGLAGQLLAPVLDLVESAAAVEDIAERLHGVYPDMDDSTFEDLLMRAIFVASVWGRLSAQTEVKNG